MEKRRKSRRSILQRPTSATLIRSILTKLKTKSPNLKEQRKQLKLRKKLENRNKGRIRKWNDMFLRFSKLLNSKDRKCKLLFWFFDLSKWKEGYERVSQIYSEAKLEKRLLRCRNLKNQKVTPTKMYLKSFPVGKMRNRLKKIWTEPFQKMHFSRKKEVESEN